MTEYCGGCNTRYVDTDCGQEDEHAGCPHPCGICGKPITGRNAPESCAGHTTAEARARVRTLREGL